jgi:hypothetical protein
MPDLALLSPTDIPAAYCPEFWKGQMAGTLQ